MYSSVRTIEYEDAYSSSWGGTHDIFELAKMEWEELREHLRNSE